MTEITFAMKNGMRRKTEADDKMLRQCYDIAVPLSTLWHNTNDTSKIITWDHEWETYLEHRSSLLDEDGRSRYYPWNVYETLGLQWKNGYAYAQTRGDCASFGHKNALKYSNFTNALRTGKTPQETAQSVIYAIARGEGSPAFGDGCTLTPIAKYSAELGNFWTEDFGAYNGGGYVDKYTGSGAQATHAKQMQSIIVFLPNTNFDTVYKVCAAGFGINMATGVFPASAQSNSDGVAQVSGWDSGGHSMAFCGTFVGKSGKRYVYLENSHGAIYSADSLHLKTQYGCWLDENDFQRCGRYGDMYGNWYCCLTELC